MSTPLDQYLPAAQAASPAIPNDGMTEDQLDDAAHGAPQIGGRAIVRPLDDSRFGQRLLAVDPRRETDCVVWCFDAVSQVRMPAVWAYLKNSVGQRRPHVLPIDAVGRERGGVCWAATPFVGNHDGMVTLEGLRIARGGAMTVYETVRAVEQLLDATVRCHEAGSTHGEIDPTCILVTPRGTLEIAMYGLAHAIESRRDEEEARAREVRSIAAIGWRLLTGRPVADDAEDARQAQVGEAFRAWVRRAADPVDGFESAADALRSLPPADAGANESRLIAARSLLGRLGAVVGVAKPARADAKRNNGPAAGVGSPGDR